MERLAVPFRPRLGTPTWSPCPRRTQPTSSPTTLPHRAWPTEWIPGPWTNNLAADTNLLPMPSLGKIATRSSLPFITNAIAATDGPFPYDFSTLVNDHTNDTWQSSDGINEPFGTPVAKEGAPMAVTNTAWIGTNSVTVNGHAPGTINYYTHNFDVWLQPGAVAFCHTNTGTPVPLRQRLHQPGQAYQPHRGGRVAKWTWWCPVISLMVSSSMGLI